MKIKAVKIKGFKCLGPSEVSFTWNDIVVCVGENNVGKSSILQAIDLFFSNSRNVPAKYFRNYQEDGDNQDIGPIEITVHFTELTGHDKNWPGIKNRLTNEGDWVLLKKFEYKGGDKSEKVKYFTYTNKKEIEDIGRNSTWKALKEKFPDSDLAKDKPDNGKIADDYDLVVDELYEKKSDLVNILEEDGWRDNPGGWLSNIESIFKNKFKHIFVKAVHDAETECGNKNSTFSKLIELFVSDDLNNKKEIKELKESLSKVVALFEKNAKGEYPLKKITELEKELSEKLSRIIPANAQISVNSSDEEDIYSNILPSAILKINDQYLTDVSDQGHGLQRALILSLLEVLAEAETKEFSNVGPNNIIIIEEPELYMHPQMERKMKDVLYAIANSKKFQVICTTHSPVFLDMAEKQESIVILEKDFDRKVSVKQVDENIFSGSTFQDEKARLRMILSFDSTVNELFFAKRVVLVEGDSEIAVFPRAAGLLGINNHIIRDTTLINCRGKRTILAFIRVLNHFGIKFLVVHDRDDEKDTFNNTIKELTEEKKLGSVRLVIEKLEAVLQLGEVKKDKPIIALRRIEELYSQKKLKRVIKSYIDFIYPDKW